MAVELHERAERFASEIGELRIEDPAPGRHGLWLRVGAVLMVVGLLATLVAVGQSMSTTNPLAQRDAQTIAVAGVAGTIVGAAVYLRYSVTKVLRFWLARLSFDLQQHADQLAGKR